MGEDELRSGRRKRGIKDQVPVLRIGGEKMEYAGGEVSRYLEGDDFGRYPERKI